MRTNDGRTEVLIVTYANGEFERFPDAVQVDYPAARAAVTVYSNDGVLAVLVLANVRKWEWVEAS